MISVRGIKKSFGEQILYDGADLQLNAGDRYALVGPNGAGKTTLFKMILGMEELEGGSIEWKRRWPTARPRTAARRRRPRRS